jgi:Fe-S cluster assembly protein SufD
MADKGLIKTRAEDAFAGHFAGLPADDPMRDIRADAFETFAEKGLPHRRVEDWKYTDLRALMDDAPAPAAPAAPEAAASAMARADLFDGIERDRIVFINGHFMPALSDTAGLGDAVEFASLGRFLADGGAILDRYDLADPANAPVLALNSAFVGDGAVIRIREGAKLARPLEIVTLFTGDEPGLQTLRHQVAVEAGAEATILQTYAGPDGVAYQTNIVAEIRIAEGARLNWIKAQEEGDQAFHLGLILPRLEAGAVFDPFIFGAGSAVARSEIRMAFDGENAISNIRGTTIARGSQHIDTTLVLDHTVPGGLSREFFKAAIDGEAKGVFQGKITVRQAAQKTDGQMMSQALLLSDGAEFANKPELEIFADDVQCAHGATCGQIDEDMLFFLRSRGIDAKTAEQLLVQAFLAEAIEEIGDEAIVDVLEARTRRWLGVTEAA